MTTKYIYIHNISCIQPPNLCIQGTYESLGYTFSNLNQIYQSNFIFCHVFSFLIWAEIRHNSVKTVLLASYLACCKPNWSYFINEMNMVIVSCHIMYDTHKTHNQIWLKENGLIIYYKKRNIQLWSSNHHNSNTASLVLFKIRRNS